MKADDKEFLANIANLCEQASEQIHTENEKEEEVLTLCDKLMEAIDEILD